MTIRMVEIRPDGTEETICEGAPWTVGIFAMLAGNEGLRDALEAIGSGATRAPYRCENGSRRAIVVIPPVSVDANT